MAKAETPPPLLLSLVRTEVSVISMAAVPQAQKQFLWSEIVRFMAGNQVENEQEGNEQERKGNLKILQKINAWYILTLV